MSRGLGPIQIQALDYLQERQSWGSRAAEIARHIFGLEWGPTFGSSEYQTVARALRTLKKRGLIAEAVPGVYYVPEKESSNEQNSNRTELPFESIY